MSLNHFMHPRNRYKNNRPDFKKFALESEEFRKVAIQSLDGKVNLNFKDPESLRALCKTILKLDFGLSVEIPIDRLIPTIPQRLNYLLWIQDILINLEDSIKGIDIGCGACCIYPLLGVKELNWRFIATELDDKNLEFARKNIQMNKLDEQVTVLKADESLLTQALQKSAGSVQFCMCNPPFYDQDETTFSRSEDRPECKSTSTAHQTEKNYSGGEVKFIKRIIDESLVHKNEIRLYTSLCGKKSSLPPLKQFLREHGITNYSTTEFCQGKTMRWAIGWSFDPLIKFPSSLFKEKKKRNSTLTLQYNIPSDIKSTLYSLPDIKQFIKTTFNSLKIDMVTLNTSFEQFVACATARENTWANSRRKRRQAMREAAESEQPEKACKVDEQISKEKSNRKEEDCTATNTLTSDQSDVSKSETLISKTLTSSSEQQPDNTSSNKLPSETANPDRLTEINRTKTTPEFYVKFSITLKMEGVDINLKMSHIDGNKDAVQQIYQFIKNRLV